MLVELEEEGMSDELVIGETRTGVGDKEVVSVSCIGRLVYDGSVAGGRCVGMSQNWVWCDEEASGVEEGHQGTQLHWNN